jgi:scyllo-inositol 2-dehydrogenase (NADP+)
MKLVIVGLGNQGKKRQVLIEEQVVATVDPFAPDANYRAVEDVPLDAFEAAFVCTPEDTKLRLLQYLLSNGKHVLVEKPLLAKDATSLQKLAEIARDQGVVCYTGYNHRFEPHIVRLKTLLDEETLGTIYRARFFYGNGTARDVRNSAWRDQGMGVLSDLGSHLLDWVMYLFGMPDGQFEMWSCHCFENRAYDHAVFGFKGRPNLELETSLISWRNTVTVDVFGELGSAHIEGLCKWGPSTLTVRKRVFPSGRPEEDVETVECADPTWELEHTYFEQLCKNGRETLDRDLWINAALNNLAGFESR